MAFDFSQQPLDGVVRVARLVGHITLLVLYEWAKVYGLTRTHPATSYILKNKNIFG